MKKRYVHANGKKFRIDNVTAWVRCGDILYVTIDGEEHIVPGATEELVQVLRRYFIKKKSEIPDEWEGIISDWN